MTARKSYRVNVGLSYPTKSGEKRARKGDIVSDLPGPSLRWLLSRGHVSLVEKETE